MAGQATASPHGWPGAWGLGAAAAAFAATMLWVRGAETQFDAADPAALQLTAAGKLRPLAEVGAALRELKLVTVSVEGVARVEEADESWRGNVRCVVEAPVRYQFGVDFAKLEPDAVSWTPFTQKLSLVLPPPELLSAEVDTGRTLREDVQVSGTRLRSRAGEYVLGQARRKLTEAARNQSLPPAKLAEVRQLTVAQTEALVRKLLGGDTEVSVRIQE